MSTQTEVKEIVKRNEQKWSETLWNAGWTGIPSILFKYQNHLGLDAINMNIIIQLASYWWYEENLPHPSKTTIARRIGVHPSTVRRRIAALEKGGLIQRVERFGKTGNRTTNYYDFQGLIKKALPYAEADLKARNELREREKSGSRRGMRPTSLSLVMTEPDEGEG